MSLIVWCSADAKPLKEVIGSVIAADGIPHRVHPSMTTFPDVMPGDVVLACGSKVIPLLQSLGLIPKNRTITSLREKPVKHNGATILITFDPGIASRDYARLPEIQWDVQLAIRIHRTGSTRPEIGEYRYVESLHELIEKIENQYARTGKAVDLACDLETKSFNPYNPAAWIIACSFTVEVGKSDVLYFDKTERPVKPLPWTDDSELNYYEALWLQLEWLLTSEKVSMRGANFKYDSNWMIIKWGIACTNQRFDTMLVGSLLDENRSNSLKLHAKIMTPMGGYEDDMDKYDMGSLELVPKEELRDYVGGDTDATYRVAIKMKEQILKDKALSNFYIKLLQPAAKAFEKMERRGVLVDVDYYHQLQTELDAEILSLQHAMLQLMPNKMRIKYKDSIQTAFDEGKSPFKPAMLKEFLFTPAGLNLKAQVFTEKEKEPSTSMDHLMMFEGDPVAAKFIGKFRELGSASKTQSSFVIGFLKHLRPDGRFHPSYMLHRGDYGDNSKDSGTTTGRTSAKDPAIQCLKGDAIVCTDKGDLQIEEVVRRFELGEDFLVLTHTGAWRRVVGSYRNGVKPVFDVSFESGRIVPSTANHPYLTSRGWVRTDDLSTGDTGYELRASNEGLYQPNVSQLDGDEEQVQQRDQQGLPSLWGEGNLRVREVAQLRELSCRHGREALLRDVHRTKGREWELRAGELCLGNSEEAGAEQTELQVIDFERENPDGGGLGRGVRYKQGAATLSTTDRDALGASLDESSPAESSCFQEVAVTGISYAGEFETFDLTIEGSHSFIANGVVVHNTVPKHSKWAKRLRRAFIPPPGYVILQCDFSQGELRITACVADEPKMIEAYANGMDLHALTAAQLNGYTLEDFFLLPEEVRDELRSGGKAGNFGLIYGMQHKGFREYAYTTYGVEMTEEDAFNKREAFFCLYDRLPAWHEEYKMLAHNWGMVRSPLGRIRHLPLIGGRDRDIIAQCERQAINSPIQSCLSDMMMLAIALVDREFGENVQTCMMCHDSMVAYIKEGEVELWASRVKYIMENLPLERDFGWNPQLKFIADAEVGVDNFAELKKLKNL